ncbi:DUF4062 domain-containing protein [Synechococcus elongatus]|nr:DUF4062 domain-containing protein [Synechococcus elongatus]WKW06966.1 DUF4062 domain-containing protein [Synechococcus elongatus PCC 7942 = FACHB-805]
MIASPSDVAKERNIIRNIIYEWNTINSIDRKIVLDPVGWETHAHPDMSGRAQSIINKQILKDCDLLVAVFWTRLGTPTGKFISGTVEEIEEHLKSGKQAMIYFSRAPVYLESVDQDQYKALCDFRSLCQQKGLIETYESLEEFQHKFSRQISQKIIQNYSSLESTNNTLEVSFAPELPRLSDLGKDLLIEVASDSNGELICLPVMGGLMIETNNKQLADMGNARSEASWKSAISELIKYELMESLGGKGEVYRLTEKGYQVADHLGAP